MPERLGIEAVDLDGPNGARLGFGAVAGTITMVKPPTDGTDILTACAAGDESAISRLLPLVYDDLRAIAARYMHRERPDHTLRPTALVHEAYLRLIDASNIDWCGRTHFFAVAAKQMRRVLVEHARAHRAQKRGAGERLVTLDENIAGAPQKTVELLALDEALERLTAESPRQARVVELRVFAGLDVSEIAYVLRISERTVKQDWRVARAWLRRELGLPGRSLS